MKKWRLPVPQETPQIWLPQSNTKQVLVLFRTISSCNTLCFGMGFIKEHALRFTRKGSSMANHSHLPAGGRTLVEEVVDHLIYPVFHSSLRKPLSVYCGGDSVTWRVAIKPNDYRILKSISPRCSKIQMSRSKHINEIASRSSNYSKWTPLGGDVKKREYKKTIKESFTKVLKGGTSDGPN